jgi:predicted LPLAT superfamily acyltransferase
LNKIAGLAANQLCMPPLVQALCIEAGYYLRNGHFLTEISLQTLGYEAFDRLADWIFGALVMAPCLALLLGCFVFCLAKALQLGIVHLAPAQAFSPANVCSGIDSRRGTTDFSGAISSGNGPPPVDAMPASAPGLAMRWPGRSLGSRLQYKIFYTLIRLGTWRAGYVPLFFVTLWYSLWPPVQKKSRPYLSRRFPQMGGLRRIKVTWLLYWNFGKVLVDRAASGILGTYTALASEEDKGMLRTLRDEGTGIILLTAHVGPWQTTALGLSSLLDIPVHVVMRRDSLDNDKPYFEHNPQAPPFSIIDPQTGPAAMVALLRALETGGLACMMGDRSFGDVNHCADMPFLGGKAPLPWGAYYLASVSGAPVVICGSRRTAPCTGEYFIAKVLRIPAGLPKKAEAFLPYLEQFAAFLEQYVEVSPFQFFNFYDMWNE